MILRTWKIGILCGTDMILYRYATTSAFVKATADRSATIWALLGIVLYKFFM